MKKLLALILALVMAFSVCTVAFATDDAVAEDTETTTPVDSEETAEGEEDALAWLLDLPFWTVGPALKFAKIALKLVKVYVKLAIIFGVIDENDIIGQIEDLIAGAVGGTEEEVTDPVVEEEVTQAPEAA